MKVLVASHNYPRSQDDPAGAFVARLAAGVAARGHQVLVVAPHARGLADESAESGVTVRRFRYAPEPLERVAYRGDLHRIAWQSPLVAAVVPFFLSAYGRAIRRQAREFRADLVHAHWWFPGGWAAAGAGCPFVVTCHGTDVRLLDQFCFFRRMAARVFARAAAVTTVSGFLSEDLRRLLGPRAPVPVVTPMPVDLERFAQTAHLPRATPPRILFAGNLLRSKGVDLVIRAVRMLTDRSIECRFRVVGEGPARRDLGRLAAELGVAQYVEFAGWVPLPDMPGEYAAATVTVLPTRGRAEGLGLALVEALMAGCAVVGSPAGGIPEVVRHEDTGLLARDGDAADFAEQLRRMLTDADLRRRTVERGRAHVRRTYAPDASVSAVLSVYHAAVGRAID